MKKQITVVTWLLFGVWLLCLLTWLEPTASANDPISQVLPVAMLVLSVVITFLRHQETNRVPPRDMSRVVMVITFLICFRTGHIWLILFALAVSGAVELLSKWLSQPDT